jgi:hypothetical protein
VRQVLLRRMHCDGYVFHSMLSPPYVFPHLSYTSPPSLHTSDLLHTINALSAPSTCSPYLPHAPCTPSTLFVPSEHFPHSTCSPCMLCAIHESPAFSSYPQCLPEMLRTIFAPYITKNLVRTAKQRVPQP